MHGFSTTHLDLRSKGTYLQRWGISFVTMTWITEELFDFRQEQHIYLFQRVQNGLISNHPPTQWVLEVLFLELMCSGCKVATQFHVVLWLRMELHLRFHIRLYVVVLNWFHDSFTIYVYWLLVIILFCGAQNILLKVLVRGSADKSLARPTSRCSRTESIVSLERGVCSSAELQVFSCYVFLLCLVQWMKGSRSGDAFDFNNIETRAVIKLFFCKEIHAILQEKLG